MSDLQLSSTALGIEFGSTRIKAMLIGPGGTVLAQGGHTWQNEALDGVWTYSYDAIVEGLQDSYGELRADFSAKHGRDLTEVGAIGISGMMHGYLPLDGEGKPLTEFRTWRNTFTSESSRALTELFGMNIPQRWSISHALHALKHGKEHVNRIAHLTTLAGYVHYLLSGEFVMGVGEASGMFPIGSDQRSFDDAKLAAFAETFAPPYDLAEVLPAIAVAGENAGALTEAGARLLDPSGTLRPGAIMAPPEGDAGTGMVATHSIAPKTGNVSAGTSAFAMIVLDKPLTTLHEEIDVVATPSGAPVAMAHSNNCTSDLNAWVTLFREVLELGGASLDDDELYTKLFATSLDGSVDDGRMLAYNFMSGEHLVGLPEGRPALVRHPEGSFTLPNLMRTHLFSAFASMSYGIKVLRESEDVPVESMFAHGGIFATEGVAQRFLAAAFDTPVSVATSASEGGAWGMALLAGYLLWADGRSLDEFLLHDVFDGVTTVTVAPRREEVEEYGRFLEAFERGLGIEHAGIDAVK